MSLLGAPVDLDLRAVVHGRSQLLQCIRPLLLVLIPDVIFHTYYSLKWKKEGFPSPAQQYGS